MYVRLRTEWNSYWKDSILELSDDNEARDLIRKRIAISAKKDDCMRTIGRVPREKSLWEPPSDKMVSQAPKKKEKKKKRNHRSEAPTGAHGNEEMI